MIDPQAGHILAVDNEIHMLKLLERIIVERTPHRITSTDNALEAPHLLERERFDLIITDLRMPGLDGMDLLKMIISRGQGEEVVLISAFGTPETEADAYESGAFDFIVKPFSKKRIISVVNQVMRIQSERRRLQRLEEILEIEPFSEAGAAFRGEYLNKLRARCEGNAETMAALSGLSLVDIEDWMKLV